MIFLIYFDKYIDEKNKNCDILFFMEVLNLARMTKNNKFSHFEVSASSRLKTAGFEYDSFSLQASLFSAFPQGQYRVSAYTGTPDFFYRAAKVA